MGFSAVRLANSETACVEAEYQQIIKTVAASGTPEALTATAGTFARHIILIGKKAARTPNSGNVYLGHSSSNDSQPYEVFPGDVVFFPVPTGSKVDLSKIYLDVATNGDGVVIWYL